MTRVLHKGGVRVVVIEPQPDDTCALCGAREECRPYGPKGETVCWGCANKDPAAMTRAMDALFGVVRN